MPQAAAIESAKAMAMRWLAQRARSEAWLRRKLGAAGFEADVVDAALARLRELGFVDDAQFALARAQSLLAKGRLGPSAVRRRLEGQGIDEATSETAVREAQGDTPERELALAALRARHPRLDHDSSRAERLRAARFLAGRGFGEELIAELLQLDDG